MSKPVHIQVFVTLTCPYCPMAVQLAHEMAMESPLITSDMVEATEFEGALPESEFFKYVMEAGK